MNKVACALAGPVLAAGIILSLAGSGVAAAQCGHRACSDEVALSGLSGGARSQCFKAVIQACNAGTCTCGGSSAVTGDCRCPAGTTTTTATRATTSTATTPT